VIHTPRLRLVALDAALARLERDDRALFFESLGAPPTPAWPPLLYEGEALDYARTHLAGAPHEAGWHAWIFIEGGEGPGRIVGAGGFTGPPDGEGVVELGYATLDGFEGHGYASEAVEALLVWATADGRLRRVAAHTEVDAIGAYRVLEKNGFARTGETPLPGVAAWVKEV
jgi:RimJ/RimL family protein N-acetyltransferase